MRTDGRTDKYDEANSCFSKFLYLALKLLKDLIPAAKS